MRVADRLTAATTMVAVTAFAQRSRRVTVPTPAPAAVSIVGRVDGRVAAALRRLPRPPLDGPRLVVVELGERFRTADNVALLRAVAVARARDARAVLVHAGAGGGSLLATAAKEADALDTAVIALKSGGPGSGTAAVSGALALAASGRAHLDVTIDASGDAREDGWERHTLPPGRPAHRGGVVVVTGGLGGIGLRVAHMLARELAVHTVLLDRRSPQDLPDADRRRLLALLGEPPGATVSAVDLTAPASVAAALAPFAAAGIAGVIHCSGTLVAGEVAALTPEDLSRAQAAKVDGLHHVLAALDQDRLRYLVTFGSITATAPHRGLGAYALANELLARATLRYGRDLPRCTTVAAQWSLWAGAGMAHELGAVNQAIGMGMWPVPLGAGLGMVLRLLSLPAGVHSLVLTGGRSPRPDGTDGPSPRP
ncbi:MAG TPA: KR domain-containing protein [Nitriliruptorales bacterium]|nr:KR domain-containing protein [Nitriliruptorales bacterium]